MQMDSREFPVPPNMFPFRPKKFPVILLRELAVSDWIFVIFRGRFAAWEAQTKEFPVYFPVHGNLGNSVADGLSVSRRRRARGGARSGGPGC
jgi:hypothetical protein